MNSFPKNRPTALSQDENNDLRRAVLRRDRWHCQKCGSTTNLEVHHQQLRSHGGTDVLDNLITLCRNCHAKIHTKKGEMG
jgi:5-methylcytosine-specific restriction endonuclease McrA